MTFQTLRDLFEIDLCYTALSALAIHAGKGGSFEVTDSPIIRIAGKPAIPGSSLKGALRSTLEAMLAEAGHRVCVPLAAIPNFWQGRPVRGRDDQKAYARSIGRDYACEVSDPCAVCQIFGTTAGKQGLSGRALCLDAYAEEAASTVERNHVAIARDSKSQAGGKLMTVEAVEKGTQFRGEAVNGMRTCIRLVNPEDWQIGAMLRALEGVELLGMGAKKTAGYGQLEIKREALRRRWLGDEGWQTETLDEGPFLSAFDAFRVSKGRR